MVKITEKEANLLFSRFGTPLFLYDESEIEKRVNLIKKSFNYDDLQILYPVKTNSNISIVKLFKKLNFKIDASSPGDVFIAQKAGFKTEDIFATGPNWTNSDLMYYTNNNIFLDLDSISQIERYGKINPNSKIGIRINPGIGTGLHASICAGGEKSKLGIQISNIEKALEVANKYDLEVIGVHFHIGSSSFEIKPFLDSLKKVLTIAEKLNNIHFVNIGGGCGVGFGLNEKDFDIKKYGKEVVGIIKKFNSKFGKKIQLRVELGEFLMWPCAVAIGKVNTIKTNKRKFVGIDINSNHIPTPLLYDTYHKVRTFSKRKKEVVDIAGNLCQAGDLLAKDRKINKVVEGDFVIIENVGAYCLSRSSQFNSRLRPIEVLRLKNGKLKLIRKETLKDLLIGQII